MNWKNHLLQKLTFRFSLLFVSTALTWFYLFQAELLAKKYEEKYKQVAEIASKLTIEEASFRDIQVKNTSYLSLFYLPDFLILLL